MLCKSMNKLSSDKLTQDKDKDKDKMKQSNEKIAFQGFAGAYSDMACRQACPEMETIPCSSFEEAFKAVQNGKAIWP